eukprot:6005691-Prymnesium_polylepis.1
MGRVSRPAPGKDCAYVLHPVLADGTDGGSDFDVFSYAFRAWVAGDPLRRQAAVFVAEEEKRLGLP